MGQIRALTSQCSLITIPYKWKTDKPSSLSGYDRYISLKHSTPPSPHPSHSFSFATLKRNKHEGFTQNNNKNMLTKCWLIQLSVHTERSHADYAAAEAKRQSTNNKTETKQTANYLQEHCFIFNSILISTKSKTVPRTLFSYEMCTVHLGR